MVSFTGLRSGCSHGSFLSEMLLPLQPQHFQRRCAGDGQPYWSTVWLQPQQLSEPDAAPTAATALPEEVRRRWSALLISALAAATAAF